SATTPVAAGLWGSCRCRPCASRSSPRPAPGTHPAGAGSRQGPIEALMFLGKNAAWDLSFEGVQGGEFRSGRAWGSVPEGGRGGRRAAILSAGRIDPPTGGVYRRGAGETNQKKNPGASGVAQQPATDAQHQGAVPPYQRCERRPTKPVSQ